MTATRVPAELPIHEARANLTDLVTAAKEHGQTIVITRHGKPVAQLGPITPDDQEPNDLKGKA